MNVRRGLLVGLLMAMTPSMASAGTGDTATYPPDEGTTSGPDIGVEFNPDYVFYLNGDKQVSVHDGFPEFGMYGAAEHWHLRLVSTGLAPGTVVSGTFEFSAGYAEVFTSSAAFEVTDRVHYLVETTPCVGSTGAELPWGEPVGYSGLELGPAGGSMTCTWKVPDPPHPIEFTVSA